MKACPWAAKSAVMCRDTEEGSDKMATGAAGELPSPIPSQKAAISGWEIGVTQRRVARWLIEHDPDATRQCFAQLPVGTGCGCCYCCNFEAAANRVFPKQLVAMAEELGI